MGESGAGLSVLEPGGCALELDAIQRAAATAALRLMPSARTWDPTVARRRVLRALALVVSLATVLSLATIVFGTIGRDPVGVVGSRQAAAAMSQYLQVVPFPGSDAGAVVPDGRGFLVSDGFGNGFTLVDGAGRAVRVLGNARDRLNDPTSMVVVGRQLWVANAYGDSLTVLSLPSLRLVRTVRGAATGVLETSALFSSGGAVWVADTWHGSLAALDPRNGRVVRRVAAAVGHLDDVAGIAATATAIYVLSAGNATTTVVSTVGPGIRTFPTPGGVRLGALAADPTTAVFCGGNRELYVLSRSGDAAMPRTRGTCYGVLVAGRRAVIDGRVGGLREFPLGAERFGPALPWSGSSSPVAVLARGDRLWVLSSCGLAEYRAATGASLHQLGCV